MTCDACYEVVSKSPIIPVLRGWESCYLGLFTGHDPTRGSGRGDFKISRVGSGRVITFKNIMGRDGSGQEVSKSRGSGRVGSIGFKISRVGSGRIKKFSKSRRSGRVMTHELFSADPRVKPADLTQSAFFKLTAEGHCRAGAPRVRPADPYIIQNLPLPASLVTMLRSYVITACRTITRQYP